MKTSDGHVTSKGQRAKTTATNKERVMRFSNCLSLSVRVKHKIVVVVAVEGRKRKWNGIQTHFLFSLLGNVYVHLFLFPKARRKKRAIVRMGRKWNWPKREKTNGLCATLGKSARAKSIDCLHYHLEQRFPFWRRFNSAPKKATDRASAVS